MSFVEQFSDIARADEPLAPYTWLGLGGVAQYFAEPRTLDELASVIKYCNENDIELRMIGSGSNILIHDDGISGVVVSLAQGPFDQIDIEGTHVSCGAGALLSRLISRTVAAGLSGLEVLAGIPGTVGGALAGNSGTRSGEISQYLKQVTLINHDGQILEMKAAELGFDYRSSQLKNFVVVEAQFDLTADDTAEITKRLRKTWILKKASQPLSEQSAGCIFKNPRGYNAGQLIDKAGLKGTKVGDCEVSERHANFIVTYENATSSDMLKLIDLVQSKVRSVHGVDLELEIKIWN